MSRSFNATALIAAGMLGFLKRYPLLEVEVYNSDEVIDVTQRRIDISIRMDPVPSLREGGPACPLSHALVSDAA